MCLVHPTSRLVHKKIHVFFKCLYYLVAYLGEGWFEADIGSVLLISFSSHLDLKTTIHWLLTWCLFSSAILAWHVGG